MEKNRVPQVSEKNQTLWTIIEKKTPKTTWTGHYLKFRFQTQKRQSWFDTKIGMSNYLDWKMTHLKLPISSSQNRITLCMTNPLHTSATRSHKLFQQHLEWKRPLTLGPNLIFFSSEIRVLFFHFSLLQSELKVI